MTDFNWVPPEPMDAVSKLQDAVIHLRQAVDEGNAELEKQVERLRESILAAIRELAAGETSDALRILREALKPKNEGATK